LRKFRTEKHIVSFELVGGKAVKRFGVVIVVITVACLMQVGRFVCGQDEEWPADTLGRGKKATQETSPVPSPRGAARVAEANAAPVTIAPQANATTPLAPDQNAMAAAFAQAFAQAMAATDANIAAGVGGPDANQPEGQWAKAIEQDVNRIEQGGDAQQWQSRIDNRAELAKAVSAKVTEELAFLRRLAVDEGAKKTAKAIDLLIASREKRLNELLKVLEDETRQERIRAREERRTRTTTRPERTDRTRERPRLREREDRTQPPAPPAPGE
jgi:hypothetical protein